MREPNPRVLRRLLLLRELAVLESVDLDELAAIAENLTETAIPAGTVITAEGSRVHHILLITDGTIETHPGGRSLGPRQIYGALEVCANRGSQETAIAKTDVHGLQLSATDFFDLLEDNFGVLVATLRELARRLLAVGSTSPPLPAAGPAAGLGLVERLVLLRQQMPFASARLTPLAALAHAADEIEVPRGATLVRAGEPATHGFVIVAGDQRGAPVGLLELIAGAHHTSTFEATDRLRALRISTTAMLDVLEDHTDVGLAMLGALATELLAVPLA